MSSSSRLVLSKLVLARQRGLLPQVRFHWYQGEVRPIRDPVTGKWQYEDPNRTILRFQDTGKTGGELCSCTVYCNCSTTC